MIPPLATETTNAQRGHSIRRAISSKGFAWSVLVEPYRGTILLQLLLHILFIHDGNFFIISIPFYYAWRNRVSDRSLRISQRQHTLTSQFDLFILLWHEIIHLSHLRRELPAGMIVEGNLGLWTVLAIYLGGVRLFYNLSISTFAFMLMAPNRG